ncbi:C2H2-like zinc finger protein [Abeliophyllum distichum]|uniref:C2H2-like zinc finger protein n=1 Tax=Abeliophyllum distichum TaxID=126358 RepID=A0ABD1VQU4_9LAMI
MEEHHKELQLLSSTNPHKAPSSSQASSWPSDSSTKFRSRDHFDGPSLDLQLSISVTPLKPPSDCVVIRRIKDYNDVKKFDSSNVEALKWHAAEQIRLAAMEKAYAERVRELSRREMELAESEFARARALWERAREEVEKAEKMKEKAIGKMDSRCLEITCQSCRQKFLP